MVGVPLRDRVVGRQLAYLDLRIVSHGLVRCVVSLPMDPAWRIAAKQAGVARRLTTGNAQERSEGEDSSRYRRSVWLSCRGPEGHTWRHLEA